MNTIVILQTEDLSMNLGHEDETMEFKKTTGEMKEAVNSICAMLNKHGYGTVLFGVLPNGQVKGQKVTESTLRDVSRKIYESIEPQIIPKIEKKIFDDKEVIEVNFSGTERPYSSKGVYYIRSADEDRILPPNELRQLFEYDTKSSWDRQLTEHTMKDIDMASFQSFYDRAVACGRLKDEHISPETVLEKLDLMRNGRLTNAAYYLFSSDQPVTLKMAVFATDEKLTFLDINRVKGNIMQLINKASGYVKEHMNWRADIVGMKRVETPEVPVKALREIICNSFAHARYNAPTEHEIDIHPSKIVIYNPGEFPIGYKPEDFVEGNLPSMERNPLILNTLYLSDDVEAYGSGLRNVYHECREQNVGIRYQTLRTGFSFIFLRRNPLHEESDVLIDFVEEPESSSKLTSDEKVILALIRENPMYSAAVMHEKTGRSSRTVQRILQSLKEKNVIERIGGTRGYWHAIR